MNQYIITEEELLVIEKDDFFKYHQELQPWERRKAFTGVIRSRPYQSERDKVLDELLKFLYNANKKRFTLHELLQKMGELRQKAGE